MRGLHKSLLSLQQLPPLTPWPSPPSRARTAMFLQHALHSVPFLWNAFAVLPSLEETVIAGPSKRGTELSSHPPSSLRGTPHTLTYLLLFKFSACLQCQFDLTRVGCPVCVRQAGCSPCPGSVLPEPLRSLPVRCASHGVWADSRASVPALLGSGPLPRGRGPQNAEQGHRQRRIEGANNH